MLRCEIVYKAHQERDFEVMKSRTQYTPEQRADLIKKIQESMTAENLTLKKACEKVGLNLTTYYGWNRKPRGKKKTRKYTRRKRKVELQTSLVPVQQQTENNPFNDEPGTGKPNAYQVAEMLAVMNANSLKALLSGGLNR